MISLIIPTTSANSNYTENIVNNIRNLYPDENKVEIIVEINDSKMILREKFDECFV